MLNRKIKMCHSHRWHCSTVRNREARELWQSNNKYHNGNDKFYLKRSLLMKGSPKICPQTGLSVSDVANASPQLFNEDESSISALLNVSWNQI